MMWPVALVSLGSPSQRVQLGFLLRWPQGAVSIIPLVEGAELPTQGVLSPNI